MIEVESYLTKRINEFQKLIFKVGKCVEVEISQSQSIRGYIRKIDKNILILENNGQNSTVEIDKIVDIKNIHPKLLSNI